MAPLVLENTIGQIFEILFEAVPRLVEQCELFAVLAFPFPAGRLEFGVGLQYILQSVPEGGDLPAQCADFSPPVLQLRAQLLQLDGPAVLREARLAQRRLALAQGMPQFTPRQCAAPDDHTKADQAQCDQSGG